MPKVLKILLTIVALLAGLVLLLFIISIVAGYSSMGELLRYLGEYLKFIWFERFLA